MGEDWFRRPLARFAIRRPRPTADAVP
jgi:hypothetical protein